VICAHAQDKAVLLVAHDESEAALMGAQILCLP
jgi:ABC-type nitrate/sulfonate/bicarbonate transport system ATPase subunit